MRMHTGVYGHRKRVCTEKLTVGEKSLAEPGNCAGPIFYQLSYIPTGREPSSRLCSRVTYYKHQQKSSRRSGGVTLQTTTKNLKQIVQPGDVLPTAAQKLKEIRQRSIAKNDRESQAHCAAG